VVPLVHGYVQKSAEQIWGAISLRVKFISEVDLVGYRLR